MNPLGLLRDILTQFSNAPVWAQLLTKATLLLAVAWVAHFGLVRANPRWRTLLWRGVAVGLVLMADWTFGLPGVEIRIPAPPSVATAPAPLPQPILIERDSRVDEADTLHRAEFSSSATMKTTPGQDPVEAQPQAARPVESLGQWLAWPILFLVVWCFGAALLAIRLAAALVRLERSLRTLPAAAEDITAEVARIAAALGCRRQIQVRTSRIYAVPFQYGLMRPVLVLPERMCQPACRAQLPAVIAHELAHVRSWDFGWNAALQATSTLLWFHPLAWRIGSVHRAACDAVCDAVAASYLGDVRAYCRTLASVALAGVGRLPVLGLPMARTCDVRYRIARLEEGLSAARLSRRRVLGAALASLLPVALLAGARLAPAEPPVADKNAGAATVAAGERVENVSPAATSISPGVDLCGDPLPPGAIARLGTLRYRAFHEGIPIAAAFADNKSLVVLTGVGWKRSSSCWWDVTDGKLLRTVPLAYDSERRAAGYGGPGALTPDGKIAAARFGGQYLPPVNGKLVEKHWLKWWEVDSGRQLASIPCDDPGHFSYPLALAPDGSTAVTGGSGAVRAWDRTTGKQIAALDTKAHVGDVTISPAGKVAALITDEGLALWNFGAGQNFGAEQAPRTVLAKSATFRPAKLAFTPDGKMLAVAGYPRDVRFLDGRSGQLLRTLPTPGLSEKQHSPLIVFSSDGKQLALADMRESGTRVTVWDLATDKPRHTMESPSSYVGYGAFSPDGRFLAMGQSVLDVWDLTTGERLSTPFLGNTDVVEAIACAGQSGIVATAAADNTIRLWEARTGRQKTVIRCPHSVNGGPGPQRELAASPDGKLLACFAATKQGAIRVWDVETGKQIRDLAGRGRIRGVQCVSFSADGKRLAVASGDRKARVWNVDDGKLLSETELQFGGSSRAAFSPDLDCLVVQHRSSDESHEAATDKFHVLSVPTGKELRTFGDDKLKKVDVAFSPDGKRLLSEEYMQEGQVYKFELRLWDVAGGKEIWRKDLARSGVSQFPLTVSPDGKRFAVSVNLAPTEIWVCDMATGNVLRSFACECLPQCVSFSSDGSLFAAGMWDGTAIVWDISQSSPGR